MHAVRTRQDAIYVDTSVWCAYCFKQAESAAAIQWLASVDMARLGASWWIETEFASALGIYLRGQRLNVAQARAARAAFAQLMDMARRLNVVEQDFLQAAEWCATPGGKLRGGDALHLAIAQRHGCTHLASLDKDMQAAAQQQRMKLVEWT